MFHETYLVPGVWWVVLQVLHHLSCWEFLGSPGLCCYFEDTGLKKQNKKYTGEVIIIETKAFISTAESAQL